MEVYQRVGQAMVQNQQARGRSREPIAAGGRPDADGGRARRTTTMSSRARSSRKGEAS